MNCLDLVTGSFETTTAETMLRFGLINGFMVKTFLFVRSAVQGAKTANHIKP